MIHFDFIHWDDESGENVDHVAEHDLTTDEVESVLKNRMSVVSVSRTTGKRVTFGWTFTDRFIIVVFELDVVDGFTVLTPITAYEVDESTRI